MFLMLFNTAQRSATNFYTFNKSCFFIPVGRIGIDQQAYEPCSNDIESVHVTRCKNEHLKESDVYGIDLFIEARDFLINNA